MAEALDWVIEHRDEYNIVSANMSLGGEVSNASAYLGEIAPPAHRGRYSAFFYISTGTALLAASLELKEIEA